MTLLQRALAGVMFAAAGPAFAADIHVGSKFPFASPDSVPEKVRAECQLETNLAQNVAHSRSFWIAISTSAPSLVPNAP